MENYKKIIFAIVAFLFSIHLSFVFIYNFDKITTNTTIKFVVFKYMFPFFNQNNKIFAPDPPLSRQKLLVKYKNKNGIWTSFQNPQKEMLHQFENNRFSPIGTQIRHYDYLMRHVYDAHIYTNYYLNNSKDTVSNSDSLKLQYLMKYEGFKLAQRYFSDLINHNSKAQNFDSLQFKIVYTYPEKYKAKPLKKIKSTYFILDYPTIPILQ